MPNAFSLTQGPKVLPGLSCSSVLKVLKWRRERLRDFLQSSRKSSAGKTVTSYASNSPVRHLAILFAPTPHQGSCRGAEAIINVMMPWQMWLSVSCHSSPVSVVHFSSSSSSFNYYCVPRAVLFDYFFWFPNNLFFLMLALVIFLLFFPHYHLPLLYPFPPPPTRSIDYIILNNIWEVKQQIRLYSWVIMLRHFFFWLWGRYLVIYQYSM